MKNLNETSSLDFDRQRIQALGGSLIVKFNRPFLSEEQTTELRLLVQKEGLPGDTDSKINNVRRSRVCFLDPDKYGSVYDIAYRLTEAVNEHYQFDIRPFNEPIQIAAYDAAEQGCYGWHPDIGPLMMGRKISISIPLSDSTEYKGGEFQFMTGGDQFDTVLQRKGCPIIFPSFLWHRVTPVTEGVRYSLVAWLGGPSWR